MESGLAIPTTLPLRKHALHYPPISFTTLLMEFAFIAVVGFVRDPAAALSGSALGEMSFYSGAFIRNFRNNSFTN